MKKLFQVKFILFIFLSFFVFDIKISSAQLIDQPCSNFAGAVCVLNPSVFQYEIMQHSVCPDVSQRCVKRRSNCTKECKKSYDCMGGPISGFCEGVDMVCCGGNMTSQQYASMDKALKKESLCPAGEIYLEVPILATTKCVKDLSDYIRILYNYGIYAASVMAVIMISINGFKWVAAGGNQSTIGKAKSGVFTAIIGLFLLFASYMILNTVNSQLILLKMPNIAPITADFLELESVSTVGLDPKYYNPNLYTQDPGHESEGGGHTIAVTICGTASQQLAGYYCVPFSNEMDIEYEFSAIVASACPDLEQCVNKNLACSNGKFCTNINNCGKPVNGYCDGVGPQVCCEQVKNGNNTNCSNNIQCASGCCCDHPFPYRNVCNSENFCIQNGLSCIP